MITDRTVWDNARMNKQNTLLIIVVGVAAAAGGLLASQLLMQAPEQAPEPLVLESGTQLSESRKLPEFSLTAGDGSDFTRQDFAGQWSLVFFGFTHCPDVCPNTLFMLDKVKEQLGEDAPQVVFVSVDPGRDTAEVVGKYVEYFDPEFIGLRGDGNALLPLTQALSVAYEFEPEGEDGYTVIHSSTVLLVNPAAELTTIFTPPLSATKISADLRRIFDRS